MPLALGIFIVSFIYPVFSWGISQFSDSAVSLAAFSVSRSLYFILASPILVIRQTVVAMIFDQTSYRFVKKFVLFILLINFLLFLIVGITPFGQFVFNRIMGVEGQLLTASRQSFIIFSVLIPFSGWYMFLQGIAILNGKSKSILYAMTVNLIFVVISIMILVKFPILDGASSATLSYVIGVAAAMVFLNIATHKKDLFQQTESNTDVSKLPRQAVQKHELKNLLLFYLPLVFATILFDISIPLINMILAKTASSVMNLSSFDIAWSLAWLALGCIEVAHQVPLYFLRAYPDQYKKIFGFLFLFGAICSLLLAVLGFTGIGGMLLIIGMGIDPDISQSVVEALRILSVFPVVYTARQYFWGVLMHNRATKPITWGKMINLACLFILLGFAVRSTIDKPVVYVFASMIISELIELAFLFSVSFKYIKRKSVSLNQ